MASTATARRLRRNATDAEALVWSRLRNRQILDAKFKRQFKIRNYVVDFFCLEARLIVELDGGQHAENSAADSVRARHLENLGYKVLRFWNYDVLTNIDGVLVAIAQAVEAAQTRN